MVYDDGKPTDIVCIIVGIVCSHNRLVGRLFNVSKVRMQKRPCVMFVLLIRMDVQKWRLDKRQYQGHASQDGGAFPHVIILHGYRVCRHSSSVSHCHDAGLGSYRWVIRQPEVDFQFTSSFVAQSVDLSLWQDVHEFGILYLSVIVGLMNLNV